MGSVAGVYPQHGIFCTCPSCAPPSSIKNVYKKFATQKLQVVNVDRWAGDTAIVSFVVGKMPDNIMYEGADCYLDFEDLPPDLREGAMLLHAAITDEPLTKIPGLGSVRKLEGGCLYFRLYV